VQARGHNVFHIHLVRQGERGREREREGERWREREREGERERERGERETDRQTERKRGKYAHMLVGTASFDIHLG